jgi:D-alanyl-D-alanine dipeptidase
VHDVILMSDPTVTAIPVRESGETLCDLRQIDALRLDPRQADADGAYAHLREGVVRRLLEALLPPGLRLLVVEGYRPLSLQVAQFERYAGVLRRQHPDWSDEVLHRETSRSLSPPDIAPHVAGAAVDVTLCTAEGQELPMGGEVNAAPEDDGGSCYTAAPGLSPASAHNRKLLVDVLTATGLVNYPTEWWHWSYGDRYWAMATGAPVALYGPRDEAEVTGPARG